VNAFLTRVGTTVHVVPANIGPTANYLPDELRRAWTALCGCHGGVELSWMPIQTFDHGGQPMSSFLWFQENYDTEPCLDCLWLFYMPETEAGGSEADAPL